MNGQGAARGPLGGMTVGDATTRLGGYSAETPLSQLGGIPRPTPGGGGLPGLGGGPPGGMPPGLLRQQRPGPVGPVGFTPASQAIDTFNQQYGPQAWSKFLGALPAGQQSALQGASYLNIPMQGGIPQPWSVQYLFPHQVGATAEGPFGRTTQPTPTPTAGPASPISTAIPAPTMTAGQIPLAPPQGVLPGAMAQALQSQDLTALMSRLVSGTAPRLQDPQYGSYWQQVAKLIDPASVLSGALGVQPLQGVTPEAMGYLLSRDPEYANLLVKLLSGTAATRLQDPTYGDYWRRVAASIPAGVSA